MNMAKIKNSGQDTQEQWHVKRKYCIKYAITVTLNTWYYSPGEPGDWQGRRYYEPYVLPRAPSTMHVKFTINKAYNCVHRAMPARAIPRVILICLSLVISATSFIIHVPANFFLFLVLAPSSLFLYFLVFFPLAFACSVTASLLSSLFHYYCSCYTILPSPRLLISLLPCFPSLAISHSPLSLSLFLLSVRSSISFFSHSYTPLICYMS